jgi:protocatechuate 3,4-dioxygenase beta subunit
MSDEAGRFSISGIAPSTYAFEPERSGYFYPSSKKTGGADYSIKVAPGQKISNLRLTMAPKAILTGRVLDEAGVSIRNAVVYIESGLDDFRQQIQHEILELFSPTGGN